MSTSDQELLERWTARHDAEAFKDLSKRYAGMVYATCRRILGNDIDAEDVTQECFMALLHTDPSRGAYLGPWLHRVATNRALKWHRSNARRQAREKVALSHPDTVVELPDKEILALVDEAIAALPEEQRIPVVAYFLGDQTQAAIAMTLGITRQAVALRIRNGVESIRSALKRKGVTASTVALSTALAREANAIPPATLSTRLGRMALQGPFTGEGVGTALLLSAKAKMALMVVTVLVLIGLAYFLKSGPPTGTPEPGAVPLGNMADREEPSVSDVRARALGDAVTVQSSNDDALSSSDVDSGLPGAMASTEKPETPGDVPEEKRATISGFVVDEGAFPIPNAVVSITVTAEVNRAFEGYGSAATLMSQTTRSDQEGRYQLSNIPPWPASVSAVAPGYKTVSTRLHLQEGQVRENVDLVLTEGVALNGVVVSESGRPIEGAVIAPLGSADRFGYGSGGEHPSNIAITDGQGKFSVGFRAAGMAAVEVSAADYGATVFTGLLVGESDPVTLRLGAVPSLRGTISHGDGSPADDVTVVLSGRFAMDWVDPEGHTRPVSGDCDRRSAKTDREGHYVFDQISANADYSVQVTNAEGKHLSFAHNLGAIAPGTDGQWDHVLQPMIRVYGTVSGAQTGKPITDLRISYVRDNVFTEGFHLNGDNRYELRFFEAGTYAIFPEYNTWSRELLIKEYGQEVTLASGDEREVNFELPDPFTLAVRVVDTEGEPVSEAKVSWMRITPKGTGIYGVRATDEAGRHSNDFFPGLPSRFYIEKPGYTSAHSAEITGEPGEVYPEERIVLYRMGGLEGILNDTAGEPMPGTEVKVAFRADGVSVSHHPFSLDDFLETRTDGDGRFALGDGFPACRGEVQIQVHLDDNEWVSLAPIRGVTVRPQEVTLLGNVVFERP